MKKIFLALLLVTVIYQAQSQYTTIYENSFRNWLPGQGWVMLSNDTIPRQMGMVTIGVTAGVPVSTLETMDNALGIVQYGDWYYSSQVIKGQIDKVMISPPLTLGADPYTFFFSQFNPGSHFDLYVVANPNDTTLNGLTTKILSCNTYGYNVAGLSNWANTTIRLAWRLTGTDTYCLIDNLKVINKTGLATIPDSCFRTYLQTVVPSAFIGDQLDFLSPVVLNTVSLSCPNSCIRSLEGLQYFPFLDSVNFSNNIISYIPLNPMYYTDTINLSNNLLCAAPDVPLAKHVNYSLNLLNKIPNIANQLDESLNMSHNQVYDCLDGTNRFARLDFTASGATNFGGYTYYTLVSDEQLYTPYGPTNCKYAAWDIYGKVFYDVNKNGVFDPTDVPMVDQRIDFLQGNYVFTHENGRYMLSSDTGLVNMDVTALPPYFTSTSPLVTHLGDEQVLQHDFPVIATTSAIDMGATVILPTQRNRLNVPFSLIVTARNFGTVTSTGVVKMYLPPSLPFVSSGGGTVVNDTFIWNVTLPPFGSVSNYIYVEYTLSTPDSTNYTIHIATTGDVNPANDSASCPVVISRFPHDPNSKIVTTPHVTPGYYGYYNYTISFENTGQGSASRVVVRDYLSHQFDYNTLEITGSSHPYTLSWGYDSILQFTFYPITLTPKSTDSVHADGFISYRIKALHPLQSGQSIGNYAGIYFDTQPVVNTQTAWVWAGTLHATFSGGDTTVCSNYAYIPYLDLSGGTVNSRQWIFDRGTPATSTASSQTVRYDSSGTYKVTLIIAAKEYTDTLVKYVHVTMNKVPTNPSYILNSKYTVCLGDTALLTAPGGLPGLTYHWSDGSTAQTFISHGDLNYVTVTAPSGCVLTYSNYISTATATPIITDTSSCQSASAYLTVNNTYYPHYLWSTGDTLGFIKATHYGTFWVQVKDGNGCTGRDTFVFANHAKPVVTISGDNAACASTGTTLHTTQSYAAYNWSYTTYTTYTATTPSLSAYSAATYYLTVTDINGCVGTGQFVLNPTQVTYPTVNGATSFCKGSSTILSTTPAYSHYLWSTGDTSATVTISTGGTYVVSAFDANKCLTTQQINVTVNDKYNLSAGLKNNGTCPGQNIELTALYNKGMLTASSAGCTDLTSTIGTGTTPEGYSTGFLSNTQNSTRHEILYTAAELQTALGGPKLITKVSFQLAALGSNAAVKNLTIKLGATAQTEVLGTWLPNLTEVYYAASYQPVAGWNTFTLTTPIYWDGVSNLVVDMCNYNPSATVTTGNKAICSSIVDYTYAFASDLTDLCGTTGYNSGTNVRPNIRLDYCSPLSQPVPVYTPSFNWYSVGTNATITNPHAVSTSATSDSLVKFIVTLTDTAGCSDVDSIWAIGPAYTKVTLTAYDTSICNGNSALLCAPDNATSYLWNTTEATQCISPQTPGEYWVNVINGQCTVQSNHIIISGSPIPVVTENGSVLSTMATGTYQWYLDTMAIPGANSASYSTTTAGFYYVEVNDTNGCHNTSTPLYVVATGIHPAPLGQLATLQLYPNPTTGTVMVDITKTGLKNVNLKVTDLLGQQLYNITETSTGDHYTRQLDLSALASGIYLITADMDGQRMVQRVVKNK